MNKVLCIFILFSPLFGSAQMDPGVVKLLNDKSAFFIDSAILFTQDKNVMDGWGQPHGVWRQKDKNKTILNIGEYDNGVFHGHVIDFYSNGKIAHDQYYYYGVMNGPWCYFWPNGSPRTSGLYKNGKLEGIIRDFDTSGNFIGAVEYKDGKREGIELRLYSSGSIKLITNYINGVENGIRKEYFDTVRLDLKGEFEMKNAIPVTGKLYMNGKLKKTHIYNYDEELKKRELLRNQKGDELLNSYKELLSDDLDPV